MNFKKYTSENNVNEDAYIFPRKYNIKLIILICVFFLLGIVCHVSIISRIKQEIASAINQNRNCPLYYDDIYFSWTRLSFKIKDIHIPAICLGRSKSTLDFQEIAVSLGFPSIWPLGLKVNATLRGKGSFLRTSFLWGIKKVLYIRKNSYLSSDMLNTIIGQGHILSGNISILGNVELKGSNIKKAQVSLQSKHFNLLSKTIQAGTLPFTLPSLKVAPIAIEGKMESKKMEITSFRLGDVKKGTLFVDLQGFLALNKKQNRVENVNLQGDLKIAKELLEGPLSILNLLWNIGKKPQRNGIYKIKFSGPFPTALTKPEFIP